MFITLEGIEGSGKTTQIGHMVYFLKQRGEECIVTREPGGTLIGRKNPVHPFGFGKPCHGFLGRTPPFIWRIGPQHISEVIRAGSGFWKKPLSVTGFFDATVVYQGYARGLKMEFVQNFA